MKPIRFSEHAVTNLTDREIDRAEVERTLAESDAVEPGQAGRKVYMRQYHDAHGSVFERKVAMKIVYDKGTDTLTIILRDVRIRESDEVRPGVIADFGYDGEIVRFEILSASKVVSQPKAVAYELLETTPAAS